MMLHRHFEAARTEADKPKPSAPVKTLSPAVDIAEGADIGAAPEVKTVRTSRKRAK